jgi:hypothetical protein
MIVLSVGCDSHAKLQSLTGAEKDATAVWDHLVSSGQYDRTRSVLLKSPSLQELRLGIDRALSGVGRIDVLTVFFAGHGCFHRSNYFICCRDTDPSRLSFTALTIAELTAIINDVAPMHTNIILDSCNSGGAGSDIIRAVNPEVVLHGLPMSISLLAASRAPQLAYETGDGGEFTQAMIDCLVGKTRVQTSRPLLDVEDIARTVGPIVAAAHPGQEPLNWGLNLAGTAALCRNPHYESPTDAPRFHVDRISPTSAIGAATLTQGAKLWELWTSIESGCDRPGLLAAIGGVVDAPGVTDAEAAAFVHGLSRSIAGRCKRSQDLLAHSDALSVLCCSILSRSAAPLVRSLLKELITSRLQYAVDVTDAIHAAIHRDKYWLLSPGSGPADMFYLPLRIMRLLGWVANNLLCRRWLGLADEGYSDIANKLVTSVTQHYLGAIVAVSEEQSPYILSCGIGLETVSCESAKKIAQAIFDSSINSGGNITRVVPEASTVLGYLLASASGSFKEQPVARPNHLLPALICAAKSFGVCDTWDESLHRLDGISMGVFMPDRLCDFGQAKIGKGATHLLHIGHGVWTCADVWRALESWIKMYVDAGLPDPAVMAAACIAAEANPDRVPYFIAAS